MAYNDPDATEHIDDAADTASFQRFVQQREGAASGPVQTGGDGRGFRLLTLVIGAVVLVGIVALLMR